MEFKTLTTSNTLCFILLCFVFREVSSEMKLCEGSNQFDIVHLDYAGNLQSAAINFCDYEEEDPCTYYPNETWHAYWKITAPAKIDHLIFRSALYVEEKNKDVHFRLKKERLYQYEYPYNDVPNKDIPEGTNLKVLTDLKLKPLTFESGTTGRMTYSIIGVDESESEVTKWCFEYDVEI